MPFEKRILGLLALIVGLIAGIIMLLAVQSAKALDLLDLIAGLGVLYGSYLIYRGKAALLFGWGKTRVGAWINLGIGGITLIVPGGLGGTASVLAIISGVLGLLSA
jgi:hypothetical protein